MPTPGTVVQTGGALQQAILNAQNAISAARASGILEGSLTMRKLLQALSAAQTNYQAATGSQQGLGSLVGGGFGSLTGIMPPLTQQQGLGLVTKPTRGPGSLSNQGSVGQFLSNLAPSLFGNTQPSQTSAPFSQGGLSQYQASERGPVNRLPIPREFPPYEFPRRRGRRPVEKI